MRLRDKRREVYEAFASKGLEADGDFLLLNARDALDLLSEGLNRGLSLAGVEGFIVTDEGAYQPRQDFSNDYADWKGSLTAFVIETKKLIERGDRVGIRFEVIFESPNETE